MMSPLTRRMIEMAISVDPEMSEAEKKAFLAALTSRVGFGRSSPLFLNGVAAAAHVGVKKTRFYDLVKKAVVTAVELDSGDPLYARAQLDALVPASIAERAVAILRE